MRQPTNTQLIKHLDQVLDTFPHDAPFRVDFAYKKVYALEGGVYTFYCSFLSRSCIEQAITRAQYLSSLVLLELMN